MHSWKELRVEGLCLLPWGLQVPEIPRSPPISFPAAAPLHGGRLSNSSARDSLPGDIRAPASRLRFGSLRAAQDSAGFAGSHRRSGAAGLSRIFQIPAQPAGVCGGAWSVHGPQHESPCHGEALVCCGGEQAELLEGDEVSRSSLTEKGVTLEGLETAAPR